MSDPKTWRELWQRLGWAERGRLALLAGGACVGLIMVALVAIVSAR